MRRFAIITGILVLISLSVAVAQINEPPLPPNLKIIPPGAEVPPRLAQLSGIWEGAWNFEAPSGGGSRHLFQMDIMGRGFKIAVINITPPKVQAIFSSGGSPQNPGKWFLVRDGSVSQDSIVLKWGQPGKARTLTLTPSGTPGVAQASLQAEDFAHILKSTARKK